MQQSEALIERIWQVSPEIQRVEVSVEPALAQIQPGQSLLALPDERSGVYLREHWIPVDLQDGLLVVERESAFHYSPGQIVDVIGPVGSPLPWLGGGNKHLLLIAQDTAPTSVLLLAQNAVQRTAEVALVLQGSASEYPFTAIPAAVEVIKGDKHGNWQNRDSTLAWADQIFAVVNETFWQDHFSALFHLVKNIKGHVPVKFLYGVFDSPMPCGTGACNACMVRCKTQNKLVCTDGPALDLTEVMLL